MTSSIPPDEVPNLDFDRCPACSGTAIKIVQTSAGWYKIECQACHVYGFGITLEKAAQKFARVAKLKDQDSQYRRPDRLGQPDTCLYCGSFDLEVRVERRCIDALYPEETFDEHSVRCRACGIDGYGQTPDEALVWFRHNGEIGRLDNGEVGRRDPKARNPYGRPVDYATRSGPTEFVQSTVPLVFTSVPTASTYLQVGSYTILAPPTIQNVELDLVSSPAPAKPVKVRLSAGSLLPVIPLVVDPEPEPDTVDSDDQNPNEGAIP